MASLKLEAVLLDAGGTLFRERTSRAAIYAEAARAAGCDETDQAMHERMKRAHAAMPREWRGAFRYTEAWFEGFIERIFRDELGLGADTVAATRDRLFARFADASSYRLHVGARELLDALAKQRLTVGIVSNWSERLPALLESLELDEHLDFVVCSAIERLEKPDSAIFELALARAGVGPERALHAGNDPVNDLRGAHEAGIDAVLVDHEDGPHQTGFPRVKDLSELGRWIEDRT